MSRKDIREQQYILLYQMNDGIPLVDNLDLPEGDETLHQAFVKHCMKDAWVSRLALGDPSKFHPEEGEKYVLGTFTPIYSSDDQKTKDAFHAEAVRRIELEKSTRAQREAEKAAKALEAERRAYEEAKETLAKLGPKFEPKLELAKVSKPDVVIYPEKLPTDATKSWRFPDYYHGRYYAKVATYDTKTRYGMVRLDMDGAEVQFRASMYYPQVYSGGPVVGQDVEVTFQRGEMTGVYAVTLGPVEQQLSFPFCK